MNRRALLAALSASLAGTAGCADRTGTTSPTDAPAPTDDTETPTDEAVTATRSPAESPTDTRSSFGVEIRPVEYVATAFEVPGGRGINPDDIVPESDVPEALREPLSAAQSGRFETDSVSDSLLAAVDEFRTDTTGTLRPYVELDGTRYEFDPSVPTFVAELGDEILDDYDEDRVLREDERRDLESDALDRFVLALTARGTHVPRSKYRRSVVPDEVTEFLDEYDYLEDQRGVSRIDATVRHSDPPFTITLRELTPEDVWGKPVVEESALSEDLVAFFERVLASEHRKPALSSRRRWQYFTDAAPDAYFDVTDEYESLPYFRLDGTVYSFSVGQPIYDGIPVSVDVEDTDASDRTFSLRVSPAPEAADGEVEGPFTFTSEGALPSLLWIVHDGERYLLNAEHDGRTDTEALETIDASESLATTYTVPSSLPEGTYVSRGLFTFSWRVPDQTPGEYHAHPFELLITTGDGRNDAATPDGG